MKKHILLIEDEHSIADTVCYALKTEGFEVEWKTLGREGIAFVKQQNVDVVILDIGLPDMGGFEICKEIRQFSEVPIIFLTARKEEIDRVVGLEIGADDYVTKPFSPRELAARVKVILKRRSHTPSISSSPFHIDEAKARIMFHQQLLDLTRYEYLLLKLLLSQPERIFSREQLMEQIWDAPEYSLDRTVDTHIKCLRAKLRQVKPEDDSIKTHRGMGYSISP